MTEQEEVLGWNLVLSILVCAGISFLIWFATFIYFFPVPEGTNWNSPGGGLPYSWSQSCLGFCCIIPIGTFVGMLSANIAKRMNFNFGQDESIPTVMYPENTIPGWLIGPVVGGILVGVFGILVTYISYIYYLGNSP
jgi:hypothetical protein